ncbi:NitT/TauT family transport system substrate-binding protein [Nocardioides exalbidus]|uniref:NitT/TauT family transport system substrate-binding protein n=1 Tax=Nocardioides exalbidus TaxID=402596 RepID=A0A1H4QY57_9ACTN|nr:ABC transporter substrate-binding protein [Nocardioides exalbidus]SEC24414.1 NitT/TauT family transport system substrate-binding protein [Nocardioides exalbidus]
MTLRLRATAGVLAASLLLLSACGGTDDSSASDSDSTDLTFVIASAVIGPKEEVAMYAVAQEMGYFEDEGLNVKTVNSDGSVAAVQAVGTGQGDFTAADTGSILAAVEKNVPVTTVGGLVQNWPWEIATMPGSDITSPADLDGKKIGVISLASGSAPYARAFVKAGGLDPEKDVELLPVGVGAQAASALTSGQVDALALYSQAYSVIELSGTELAYLDNPPIFDGIRSLSFAVNSKALAGDQEAYEGLLRAGYKAMLFSAENPEAAMKIGYKVFPDILAGQSEDERLADDVANLEAWLATATPTSGSPSEWSDWGAISDEDWTKTQEYTLEAGQITAEVDLAKVWDDGLLTAANDFDAAAVIKQADEWTE